MVRHTFIFQFILPATLIFLPVQLQRSIFIPEPTEYSYTEDSIWRCRAIGPLDFCGRFTAR